MVAWFGFAPRQRRGRTVASAGLAQLDRDRKDEVDQRSLLDEVLDSDQLGFFLIARFSCFLMCAFWCFVSFADAGATTTALSANTTDEQDAEETPGVP